MHSHAGTTSKATTGSPKQQPPLTTSGPANHSTAEHVAASASKAILQYRQRPGHTRMAGQAVDTSLQIDCDLNLAATTPHSCKSRSHTPWSLRSWSTVNPIYNVQCTDPPHVLPLLPPWSSSCFDAPAVAAACAAAACVRLTAAAAVQGTKISRVFTPATPGSDLLRLTWYVQAPLQQLPATASPGPWATCNPGHHAEPINGGWARATGARTLFLLHAVATSNRHTPVTPVCHLSHPGWLERGRCLRQGPLGPVGNHVIQTAERPVTVFAQNILTAAAGGS
jgi:hypothetical protein